MTESHPTPILDRILPPIKAASELALYPPPRPKDLVPGLIHAQAKVSLGGGSKSFKSWVLMDLACALSSGGEWLGFQVPEHSARVLYLNFEIPEFFFLERLHHIRRARGLKQVPGNFDVWCLRGYGASHDRLIPAILARAKEEPYDIIFADPLYKVYSQSTDENSAGGIAAVLNSIEHLAVETGSAVIWGTHFSKGNQAGKEPMDRISGSGVYNRDPDAILILTQHKQHDNVQPTYTVDVTVRSYPPVSPFVIRWEFPRMVAAPDLDPATLKVAAGEKAQFSPTELVDLLKIAGPEGFASTTAFQKAADTTLSISRTTFYRLLEKAKELPGVSNDNGVWRWVKPVPPVP